MECKLDQTLIGSILIWISPILNGKKIKHLTISIGLLIKKTEFENEDLKAKIHKFAYSSRS